MESKCLKKQQAERAYFLYVPRVVSLKLASKFSKLQSTPFCLSPPTRMGGPEDGNFSSFILEAPVQFEESGT